MIGKLVSSEGYIRNHKPKGDTLYGIEIMVDPEFRGMKLSRRLYDARKELCRQKNLARIIIGGRIPGYHKHADKMTAREYIDAVLGKSIYDQVLTTQLSNGFSVQGLIANYIPSDKESCGYATSLTWTNLDYVSGAKRRFHHVVEPIRICVVQYQMRSVKDFGEFATAVRVLSRYRVGLQVRLCLVSGTVHNAVALLRRRSTPWVGGPPIGRVHARVPRFLYCDGR